MPTQPQIGKNDNDNNNMEIILFAAIQCTLQDKPIVDEYWKQMVLLYGVMSYKAS